MPFPRHPLLPLILSAMLLTPGLPAAAQGGKPSAATTPPGAPRGEKVGTVKVGPPPGLALFNRAIRATEERRYDEAERLYRAAEAGADRRRGVGEPGLAPLAQ